MPGAGCAAGNPQSFPSSAATRRSGSIFLASILSWLVTAWLVQGAVSDGARHWAFQSLESVPIPDLKSRDRHRTVDPIDRFILARLEKAGLRPAPPATREQLIRRVSYDLIGLPPTVAEIDAFVGDRSVDAWAKVIDRLLSSSHYGERWARHWLDVVRYAESDGFEHDAARPHVWRYRDYVIESFNADKPYDRFVQEQIAGDELWPEEPAAQVATAFHLLGPDMVDSADQTQRRLLTLSDMTDTTAAAFLGLTMGCARCHDHKSEPFTQSDYYSLQAYFAAAEFQRELPVPTKRERAEHEAAMKIYDARAGEVRKRLEDLERVYRDRLWEEKLGGMSEDVQLAHRTPKDKRTMEQESSVLETLPQLQIAETELAKALTPADRAQRQEWKAALKKIPQPTPLPRALAVRNTNGPPPVTRVLLRGDYNNPGPVTPPTIPALFRRGASDLDAGTAPVSATGRRTALALWLTDPRNPLTARVVVNRIWQHHFGRGLVRTPNDFGVRGAAPSHPELIDWLAGQFISQGWSVKALHRVILLSATYQQSSEPTAEVLKSDPENRLLSRQNRLRLEGEALRDSLLSISGQLNPRAGGPSVLPPIAADIVKTSKNWTASPDADDHTRRSIYIFARRNLRYPFLETFDAPDGNLSCPERGQSTTAPQSLTLLNSGEVLAAAGFTARRIGQAAEEEDDRISAAFRVILGRRPSRADLKAAREFLRQTRGASGSSERSLERSSGTAGAPGGAGAEWRELCRALFNLNDFVYVQ